jgi:hypothetical protein
LQGSGQKPTKSCSSKTQKTQLHKTKSISYDLFKPDYTVHDDMKSASARATPSITDIGAVELVVDDRPGHPIGRKFNLVNGVFGERELALQRRIKIIVGIPKVCLLRTAVQKFATEVAG